MLPVKIMAGAQSGVGTADRCQPGDKVRQHFLLGCAALYAASRLMPGRRLLPIWGHLADLLEMWSAVAIVPLLLQLFHVYAHIRDLIH